MELSDAVYIIASGFWCYILSLYMSIFFKVVKSNKIILPISYIIYFILSLIVYWGIEIPFAFGLYNIIALLLLTLNYDASWSKRIAAVLIITVITTLTEVVIAMLFGYFNFASFEQNTFNSITGIVTIRLVLFAIALIGKNFMSIRNGVKIPVYSWIAIVILPVISLYISMLLFNRNWINNATLLISILSILVLNFIVFYLYDCISKAQTYKFNQVLLLEQNKSYEQQFSLIKQAVINTDIQRHDFKHHLAVITGLIQSENTTDCLDYISKLTEAEISKNSIANSGNIVIDSILNFKLPNAIKNGTKVKLSIIVPDEINIPLADMTVILGNLIDNAIKATEELINAVIDINIKQTKGRLIIHISNTYNNNIIIKEGNFVTTKSDKKNHGLGIKSVKSIVEKYDGELSISCNNHVFDVTTFLYLKEIL